MRRPEARGGVTWGGGSWVEDEGRDGCGGGANRPGWSQTGAQRASMAAGSKDLGNSGVVMAGAQSGHRVACIRRVDAKAGRAGGEGVGL